MVDGLVFFGVISHVSEIWRQFGKLVSVDLHVIRLLKQRVDGAKHRLFVNVLGVLIFLFPPVQTRLYIPKPPQIPTFLFL